MGFSVNVYKKNKENIVNYKNQMRWNIQNLFEFHVNKLIITTVVMIVSGFSCFPSQWGYKKCICCSRETRTPVVRQIIQGAPHEDQQRRNYFHTPIAA